MIKPREIRLVLPLLLVILVASLFPLKAGAPGLLQPVALWPASAGGLYVLDRTRGLTYSPSGPGLDLKNSSNFATFSASWQAVDMAAVHVGSEERVYVLLAQETTGMLLCYANRQFTAPSYVAKTLLTGIAPDAQGQRLFLSGGLTNQIFEFDWSDPHPNPTKVFVTVHGSQYLGPLAYDADRHVLYATDQRIGAIFAINTDSKSVSRVTQITGQVSALAFDSVHRTLYAAEAVGRKVWALAVDKPNAKPLVFAGSGDFRQPSAIAIDTNGTLWMGDSESQTIYRLAPNGTATSYPLGP